MSSHDNLLPNIIESLQNTSGEDFIKTITLQLDKVIGADYTFIARLDKQNWVSKTLCLVAKGQIADNFEYSLDHTPCADVTNDSTCVYPQDICSLYPKDQLLIDMNIEGYIGAPLHDRQGAVMGLVVALYETKIESADFVKNLFELFSGRISAEIERQEAHQKLQSLNSNLEKIVEERTVELSTALENLTATQDKMIEQEKLASLGSLVAGVAHEINTPIGVAMLSATTMVDLANKLNDALADESLSKQQLMAFMQDITESGESLTHNLRRAADLIANFKQVAVERNSNDEYEIEINQWLKSQISSLKPLLRQNSIELELNLLPKSSVLHTSPAKLSQVVVNLVQNSVVHAFDNELDARLISVSLEETDKDIKLTVSDNGRGMTEDELNKLYEPFFTTKRNKGGTGLGMSIAYSAVTGNLGGDIAVQSKLGSGTVSVITIPKVK
jgi:signal transduction histidine kinase